jgi:hypothetical protein
MANMTPSEAGCAIVGLIVVLAVLLLLTRSVAKNWQPEMLCAKCGSKVKPKKKCKGRISTEICLWILPLLLIALNGLAFVQNPNDMLTLYGLEGSFSWTGPIWLVALCYSLYRFLSPRKRVCRVCKAEGDFIPVDSPVGKKMLQSAG